MFVPVSTSLAARAQKKDSQKMKHNTAAVLMILGVLLAPALTLYAQDRTAIVSDTAPIYVLPDANRTPLRTAAANTALRVTGEESGWLKVEFQDPQFGIRTGYVETRLVRIRDTALQPMDLSIKDPEPVRAREGAHQQQSATEPSQRAMDRTASVAPSGGSRGWVDVNLGLAQSGADDALFTYTATVIDKASFYGKPTRGAEFDFGGGYMFSPHVGLGVSLTGTAHEDRAGLGAGIGSLVLASDATDELRRTEGAVNIQLMTVPFESHNFRVRAFGGPSYFRYEADMVYDFSFSGGIATDYDLVKTEGTGWGWHLGGDASYFFSRVVGIGGFARYSRGTVTIPEPMSEEDQDITVGGFQTGGGLRLRF
jgi:hypothetical protein